MKCFILLLFLFSIADCSNVSISKNLVCEELRLNVTSAFTQAFNCAASPPGPALSYLWRPKQVVITCSAAPTIVLVGQNVRHLEQQALGKPKAVWCGWQGLVNPRLCMLSLPPFHPAVVGVQLKRSTLMSVLQTGSCNGTVSMDFNARRFALGVLGVLLFLHAPGLSDSMVFRLSSGTFVFVCMGLVILAFALVRIVPQRRSLAAAMFALGSTSVAFVRWVYGTWLPSWQEVVTNPFFLCYMAVFSLLGLSVTYYFDNRNDARLTNILCVGLRLAGLVMLWCSPTAAEASSAFVALLLLTQLPWARIWGLIQRLSRLFSLVAAPQPAPHTPAARSRSSLLRQANNVPLPERESPAGLSTTPRPWTYSCTPPRAQEVINLSPLMQRGIVINTQTGRPMRTDSHDYHNMVASGWVVDHVDGCISPAPPPSPCLSSQQPDQSYMSSSINRIRRVASSMRG